MQMPISFLTGKVLMIFLAIATKQMRQEEIPLEPVTSMVTGLAM